jgi:hypothetical protein
METLLSFKRLYDRGASLEESLPELAFYSRLRLARTSLAEIRVAREATSHRTTLFQLHRSGERAF